MEVRAAAGDDVEEMIRLAAVMFASIGLDAYEPGWRNHAPEVLAEGTRRGHIGAFVVDEPGRVGRLVAAGVVVEQSVDRIELHASPDGRALYEELGFQPTAPSYRLDAPAP